MITMHARSYQTGRQTDRRANIMAIARRHYAEWWGWIHFGYGRVQRFNQRGPVAMPRRSGKSNRIREPFPGQEGEELLRHAQGIACSSTLSSIFQALSSATSISHKNRSCRAYLAEKDTGSDTAAGQVAWADGRIRLQHRASPWNSTRERRRDESSTLSEEILFVRGTGCTAF